MRYQRPVIIGASVLAFGAAVAVMLPPTKPIGGAKITSTEHQGFSPVKAAPPPESSQQQYFAPTPPMAAEQTTSSNNAASNESDDAPRETPNATGVMAVNVPAPPPMIRPRPPAMHAPVRADPRYAYADDEDQRDFSGRDYKQGYRWAQRANVQNPRDCRMLIGAQVDGCHAWLRDADGP